MTAALIGAVTCAATMGAAPALGAVGAGIVIPRAGKGKVEPSAFPHVAGVVYAAAADGRGGWYVGGSFSSVGGVARRNLVHITAGGGVDSAFDPAPDGEVDQLVKSGATVYALGDFTSIGGRPRDELAALDAASGRATAWNPAPSGPFLYLDGLAVSGSTVYVGGSFTMIGGQFRNDLAALDAATGLATPWAPDPDGVVFSLAVSGSLVYAGGAFSTIGGRSRHGLAALDAAGSATPWDPDPRGARRYVDPVAVAGSTVYVGGGFTAIGGRRRHGLAALDATTGRATRWDPHPDDVVFALVASGSTIYLGGQFSTIAGTSRGNVAALDAVSGRPRRWNPRLPRPCAPRHGPRPCVRVHALAVSGSAVYVGEERGDLSGLRATSTTRLRHGRSIRLHLSCPVRAASCTGTAKLRTVTRLHGRRRALRTDAFTTSGGRRIRLRLSRHAARLLRHAGHRRIRVRARVAMRGSTATERFTLVLSRS